MRVIKFYTFNTPKFKHIFQEQDVNTSDTHAHYEINYRSQSFSKMYKESLEKILKYNINLNGLFSICQFAAFLYICN